MFTPSTSTRNSLGKTRSTLPSLPRCSPEITRTVSPLAMCILWRSGSRASARVRLFLYTSGFMSDHLGRERHDLHEPLVAQLPPHPPADAGGAGRELRDKRFMKIVSLAPGRPERHRAELQSN